MGTTERRRTFGLVVAALIAAAVPAVAAIAAPAQQVRGVVTPSPSALQTGPADLARGVLALVNAARAKEGAPPLQVNEGLMQAAQSYSVVLGQGDCFEHTCPPVPHLQSRLAAAGYDSYSRIGENIAAGNETPEAVVKLWLDSPGHRRNMLNPAYTEIGVGVTRTADRYGVYWVQVFGAPAE